MGQTDAMLFEHWLRDRNADAFKLLATRYAAMVYHTCRRILNNSSEAEDVTQECFVILASTEKPIGGYLAPWLHRVAYNRSLARLRAENRRREREVRYASEQPVAHNMAWDEIGDYVDEAIAELPEKLRAPIVAYFLDGQTQESVALALGISRPTVTQRLDKGVECLRRTLKDRGVAVTGTVLIGAIKANAGGGAVPPTLTASLGKLALSGVHHAIWHPTAAAAPLAKTVAGFWTAKTVAAGAAGMAVVLCAGWGVHEVILRPETRVVQAQEPNRASVADKRTITSGEISFKSPQLPERAATVVLPGKNEEKNAAVQASSQDVGRGMTSGQRFEALRTGAGSTGGMIDTISNAWQDVKGTLTGESRRRSQCQNNLKQFGVVFKMFENDHPEHLWPALSPKAGHLMFANDNPGMQPVCPTYLADPGMLICPSDTAGQPFLKKPGLEVLDHSSYFYLGYVVRDIEELQAFSDAYVARVAAGLPFDTDLDTPSGKLYRLREGVERLLTSDPNNPAAGAAIQSAIPVFIEINHPNPDGGNVLFMDGHVEFIRYRSNSPFPINEAAMNILKSLSAMKGTASPR